MSVIYLVGDSTVDDNTPPFRGWGWALPQFCREGVQVVNIAKSGSSSLSFLTEGRFDAIRGRMQPGDLLLIQFGHNDEKDYPDRHTDPDDTFPQTLSVYVDAALAAGALPVLITPVSRRIYVGDGSMLYTHGEYPAAIRRLAKERDLPLADLKRASRALYLSLGQEKTAELFVRLAPGEHPDFPNGHDDMTHFNPDGAVRIAALVVGLLKKDSRTAGYFA